MGQATTLSTPKDAVDDLIKQVADEAGLAVIGQLGDAGQIPANTVSEGERTQNADDALSRRLAALRN